ncbi:argininosuccinate lyase [Pilimelia terevasa]|uniref:Argininosuccinate lyase n=1 Tax=Pilimelia terevasa TaxID=53372 RepID=A0A8J3BLD9_9ACTN|nr:ATP-grasp domain-containing protein [Pilimelia terevasa]GGK22708.1 argininosuccinate lyase [Pilimelia terevasa]
MRDRPWLVLVESNTTGTGRLFATTARALGLSPILLTADETRYPYVVVDGLPYRRVDTSDEALLHRTCRSLTRQAPIAAVMSSSDYFVATAARVAHHLGLRAPDPEAIARCRDKAAQRFALRGRPWSVPFAECRDVGSAVEAAAELGGDVVLKPALGSGSEGVRACSGADEVAVWARRLLAVTHNERGLPVVPRILVEERVHGPEFSVELIDGTVYGVTAKHLGPPPSFVETGHDVPAPVPAADRAALAAVAREACAAVGLRSGAAHVELRLPRGGPRLIEINPRLAGGMIPHLVRLATGHDMIAASILSAAGHPLPLPDRRSLHHAAIRFITVPGDGRAADLDPRAAWDVAGVVDVWLAADRGQRCARHDSFRDRIGHVIALGEDTADAADAAERGRAAIVGPHPVSTTR